MFTADGGGLYYISTRCEREEENNRQHPIRLIWAGAKTLSKIFSRYYWRGQSVKGTHLSKWPRKLETEHEPHAVEEDVMKANILSDLYDYFAYKTNPAHADIDRKYRLRKGIMFFTVDRGKSS